MLYLSIHLMVPLPLVGEVTQIGGRIISMRLDRRWSSWLRLRLLNVMVGRMTRIGGRILTNDVLVLWLAWVSGIRVHSRTRTRIFWPPIPRRIGLYNIANIVLAEVTLCQFLMIVICEQILFIFQICRLFYLMWWGLWRRRLGCMNSRDCSRIGL